MLATRLCEVSAIGMSVNHVNSQAKDHNSLTNWRNRLIRYRLLSLLILVASAALIIAAVVSHQRAWKEVTRLDSLIESSLREIDGAAAVKFKINEGREEFSPLSPYSFAGNGYGMASGGLIDGPHSIDRNIIVKTDVQLTIEVRSDWRFFAGKPYVSLCADNSPGNRWFIEKFVERLDEKDIEIECRWLHTTEILAGLING